MTVQDVVIDINLDSSLVGARRKSWVAKGDKEKHLCVEPGNSDLLYKQYFGNHPRRWMPKFTDIISNDWETFK